jgi:hypothetical protein
LDRLTPEQGLGGYAPLGVQGGLDRIEKKITEISKTAKKHNANVYILIYPWPNQISNLQEFSWNKFANKLCRDIQCNGVIDAQPLFLDFANKNQNWYEALFLQGDIHYNVSGNELVFNSLKKYFEGTK